MKSTAVFIFLILTSLASAQLPVDSNRILLNAIVSQTLETTRMNMELEVNRPKLVPQTFNLSTADSNRIKLIQADAATAYNLNWANQLNDEINNVYRPGINPVGLLMVIGDWLGIYKLGKVQPTPKDPDFIDDIVTDHPEN